MKELSCSSHMPEPLTSVCNPPALDEDRLPIERPARSIASSPASRGSCSCASRLPSRKMLSSTPITRTRMRTRAPMGRPRSGNARRHTRQHAPTRLHAFYAKNANTDVYCKYTQTREHIHARTSLKKSTLSPLLFSLLTSSFLIAVRNVKVLRCPHNWMLSHTSCAQQGAHLISKALEAP